MSSRSCIASTYGSPIAAEEFKDGMRRHLAGVCIVSSSFRGQHAGCTATAVSSVSVEPPTILVSLHQSGRTHSVIRSSRVFAVSVLSAGQEVVAQQFAGREGLYGTKRFTDESWDAMNTGAPTLRLAAANFDCVVCKEVDAGTHTVFFGTVVNARCSRDQGGLGYFDGTFLAV